MQEKNLRENNPLTEELLAKATSLLGDPEANKHFIAMLRDKADAEKIIGTLEDKLKKITDPTRRTQIISHWKIEIFLS